MLMQSESGTNVDIKWLYASYTAIVIVEDNSVNEYNITDKKTLVLGCISLLLPTLPKLPDHVNSNGCGFCSYCKVCSYCVYIAYSVHIMLQKGIHCRSMYQC